MSALDTKIIGQSKQATALKKMISLVAVSNSPVIINGPTGSGKELVAEALHSESRRNGEFIALNCAAIPRELIEAELFGFEKGAFTGALKTTKGKFEQAHKGTLFLDEIGDMPSEVQTKLLRVLETSTIERVGGGQKIKLDVRIVCATHKNLNQLVEQNLFREDLLYRLNVFPIEVPALNARASDIPDLIKHFLLRKAKEQLSPPPSFDASAMQLLCRYEWPGNVREIRNVIERAMIFFPGKIISNSDVADFLLKVSQEIIDKTQEQDEIWACFDDLGSDTVTIEREKAQTEPPRPEDFSQWFERENSVDLRKLLRDIEIVMIEAALNRNSGNTSEAAKDLKLIRTTLIEKMKKYGL